MTITPEMLRTCAEAVGLDVLDNPDPRFSLGVLPENEVWLNIKGYATLWNPVTNREQDAILRDWLLKKGWRIHYGEDDFCWISNPNTKQAPSFVSPANEFLTRAVCEVEAMTDD